MVYLTYEEILTTLQVIAVILIMVMGLLIGLIFEYLELSAKIEELKEKNCYSLTFFPGCTSDINFTTGSEEEQKK